MEQGRDRQTLGKQSTISLDDYAPSCPTKTYLSTLPSSEADPMVLIPDEKNR